MALIGYMRVSKSDGSQTTDLQRDALLAAGVDPGHLYEDKASGKSEDRPHLDACLKALRSGDTLLVWKLDRLGRNLRHLVNIVHDLTARGVGLKVLTGQGAAIDTTSAQGKLVFGIFAALAEFERELISERTKAGLESARARGRKGGRPFKMTPAKVRLAMASMGQPETSVAALCQELGITRQTLYRHVSPTGGVTGGRTETTVRELRSYLQFGCIAVFPGSSRECLVYMRNRCRKIEVGNVRLAGGSVSITPADIRSMLTNQACALGYLRPPLRAAVFRHFVPSIGCRAEV